MTEFQITCINKPNRFSTHVHITHLGNQAQGWRLTRESVIRRIEGKQEAFYTIDPVTKKRAYVGVVQTSPKHLRTYADGVWNNNLLDLPECGTNCRTIG
jgi:hypothetical protein